MIWTIITKENCPHCEDAKELLNLHTEAYEEINLEDNLWVRTLMLDAGYNTVPLMFDPGGVLIGGYSDLKEELGEA